MKIFDSMPKPFTYGVAVAAHGLLWVVQSPVISQSAYPISSATRVVWVEHWSREELAMQSRPNALEHAQEITQDLLQASFSEI